MSRNPKIRAKSLWWDSKIVELIDLVLLLNYRLKDLSEHFGKTVGCISSALHQRGISLINLRYRYSKGVVL